MKVGRDDQDELVTSADLAVERLLVAAIHDHRPEATIVSEESPHEEDALDADWCFVIDPIDGTEELSAGRPGYAISVALLREGKPHAAVLDLPALEQRFECHEGEGATINGTRVVLRDLESVSQARLVVSASQLRHLELTSFWEALDVVELVPTPGFAAKFAAVLSGRADAVLYLPVRPLTTAVWDYAAAAQLLREAGGSATTDDGSDLLGERPFIFKGGWIASTEGLRSELLALLADAPAVG